MLKRYIKASSEWSSGDLEEIKDAASRFGYNLSYSKGGVPKLMLTAKDTRYPKIEVETIDAGSGKFVFMTSIRFKDIVNDENSYPDDTKSILKDWARDVGGLVEEIQTFVYDPSIEVDY